jgi:hypothetical protein
MVFEHLPAGQGSKLVKYDSEIKVYKVEQMRIFGERKEAVSYSLLV